jgi:hypothetical protein
MLVERHPAGGYLELMVLGDIVTLRCHWPADLEHDEWIDIQNDYSSVSYLRAVDDAVSTGSGEAKGVAGGLLKITSMSGGFAIEISRPHDGWKATSLRLHVKRAISDLAPSAAA